MYNLYVKIVTEQGSVYKWTIYFSMAKCTLIKCVNIRKKIVYFLVFFFIILTLINIADLKNTNLIFLLSAVGVVSQNLFYF